MRSEPAKCLSPEVLYVGRREKYVPLAPVPHQARSLTSSIEGSEPLFGLIDEVIVSGDYQYGGVNAVHVRYRAVPDIPHRVTPWHATHSPLTRLRPWQLDCRQIAVSCRGIELKRKASQVGDAGA